MKKKISKIMACTRISDINKYYEETQSRLRLTEKVGCNIQSDQGRPCDKVYGSLNLRKSQSMLSKDTRTLPAVGRPSAQDIRQE